MHVSFFYYFLTALAKISHLHRNEPMREMLEHLGELMKDNNLGFYPFKQKHVLALQLLRFYQPGEKLMRFKQAPLDQHEWRLTWLHVMITSEIRLCVEFYLNDDASMVLPRNVEIYRGGTGSYSIVGAHLNYQSNGFVETIAEHDSIHALAAVELNTICEALRTLLSACNWCSPIFVRLIAMCLCTLEHAYALRVPTFAVDSAKKAKKEEA